VEDRLFEFGEQGEFLLVTLFEIENLPR